MRVLKWVLLILFGFIIIVVLGSYGYLHLTLPDYGGRITVAGLKVKVEIIRDSYGMPHIYAQTADDAYFALGYCMAQDRLFHMDLVRRIVRGRLSEIFGEELISTDKLLRTISAGQSIEGIVSKFPPESLSALKAYARGVNYFIENSRSPLPIEYTILGIEPEPWHYSDGVATYYYMAWNLNTAFSIEMLYTAVIDKVGEKMAQDIFPDYAKGYPTIIPDGRTSLDFLKRLNLARKVLGAEGGGASNNWVISAKMSATGMPILANDPHLDYGVPGIWYEAHLIMPSMNVSGALLPGVPYVIIGANEHVAWGFTNVMSDDADFYVEKINPANPDQYEFMGRWEDMTIKPEVIRVKGAEDVRFNVRLTRHGPIIDDVNNSQNPKVPPLPCVGQRMRSSRPSRHSIFSIRRKALTISKER